MAINKKLIHFQTKTNFLNKLEAGEILDTSIVFIRDAKQIWTHGELYSCPYTEEEINQLFIGSNIKLAGYAETYSPVEILATDTVNQAFGKIEDYLTDIDQLNAVLVDTGDAAFDPIINDYISSTQLANELQNYVTDQELATKSDKIFIVNHGTNDTIFTLTPNVFHIWGEVESLDLDLGEAESDIMNNYIFQFTSGEVPTTLILPDTIKWVNDTPEIEANMIYQCSIINNMGVICGTL